MVKPLQRTFLPTHPYVVERHDQDDGSITYEIWDTRLDAYRRLCSLNEWTDGGFEGEDGKERSTAKADAEMIARALNLMNGGIGG